MTVNVGFIGAGNIAEYHSRSLKASGADAAWSAVYDTDADRTARFAAATGATASESAEEVIERSDAVYVCTWTSEHEPNVMKVAAAGKSVFCEKPLGTDLASATRIVEAVESAGVANQVGLVLRNSPVFHLLRHLIHLEEAGPGMSVIFRDDQFLPVQGRYGSTWRADVDKAGAGVLIEHSIHDIDLLEWMYGPIAAVSAEASYIHGIEGIEDVISVNMAFESGVVGTMVSVWHEMLDRMSNRHVEVFNERLWARLRGEWSGDVAWTIHDAETGSTDSSLEGKELMDYAASVSPGSGENPDGNFIGSIAEGREAYPSLRTALRAHEVVDACYRSVATGGRIEVGSDYGREHG